MTEVRTILLNTIKTCRSRACSRKRWVIQH
jgi:hypothetical protein